MQVIEITAIGYNGEDDKADDRVIWVRADSAESVHDRLHMLDVPHLDVNEIEVKFALAGEVLTMDQAIAKLFKFAMADIRAALQPFADLLEYPNEAPAEIELTIHASDVVAARAALEVTK